MNLITRERAVRNLDNRSLTGEEALALDGIIAAVSQAISQFCRCDFTVQAYDELHHGGGTPCLLLRNYPIVAVERVACDPTTVLQVRNSSATNQQARVKVTDTGLTLTKIASGTTTTSTLTFAANATLTALASTVVALGNGWEAEAITGYGNYPSADMRPQGAFNAKDAWAGLRLHVTELVGFDFDPIRGLLYCSPDATVFPMSLSEWGPVWTAGFNAWRVLYSAGYDPVPEDVQEACAQWATLLFWQTKRDPGLSQESVAGAVSRSIESDLPPRVQTLLRPYRRYQV